MLKYIDIAPAPGPFSASKKMLIMHGRGDVKESFIPFTKELNVTGLSYRLLDAPTPFMFGHSWYAAPPTDPIPDIKASIKLIEQQIEILEIKHDDLFLAGFSQGAAMAIEMALATQKRFAGIVAMSPRIFLRDELLKSASNCSSDIFMAHGTHDDVISFEETSNAAEKLCSLGMNIEFHAYEMGHEIDIMEILKLREWVNERL